MQQCEEGHSSLFENLRTHPVHIHVSSTIAAEEKIFPVG